MREKIIMAVFAACVERSVVQTIFKQNHLAYESLAEGDVCRWKVILISDSADPSASKQTIKNLHTSIVVEHASGYAVPPDQWKHVITFCFKDYPPAEA
jgi:hypothetical protein